MAKDRRVVLVKPDDILIIANVGEFTQTEMDIIARAFSPLGIHGIMFSHDITVEGMSVDDLEALLAVKRAGRVMLNDDDK